MNSAQKIAIALTALASSAGYWSWHFPKRDLPVETLGNFDSESIPFESEDLLPNAASTFIQQPPKQGRSNGKQEALNGAANQRLHYTILQAFREAVGDNWKSTVRIVCDGHQVAMGTIIDSEGWAVTKASELPEDEIECRLFDSTKVPCKVMALRSDLDLALIRIEKRGLRSIEWSDADKVAVGAWIASSDFKERPLSIGVVSVGPRAIRQERTVLGISFDERYERSSSTQEIVVKTVLDGSGAHRAGIRVDDVIVSVNGSKVTSRQSLLERIASFKAGQDIQVAVLRNQKSLELKAELMDLNDALLDKAESEVNGRVSARSTGFGSAFQHDTVLEPNQCGGPVIDLHGKAVGINIARAGRVSSYALPVSLLKPAVQEMLASAKGANTSSKPNEGTIIRSQDTPSRPLELK